MKILLLLMMGVGRLMGPALPASGAPPVTTFKILTEASDPLVTEAGDNLVTELAP